jgi:NhaA family Na+:H+ antiporter
LNEISANNDRLVPPVDLARDHLLGPIDAPITLVEYGSYDCPHCRAANARITEVRGRLGDRLRYVFRHKPVTGSDRARRAAELAECVDFDRFWDAHVMLMTRSAGALTEEDLEAVAAEFLPADAAERAVRAAHAKVRVDEDTESARISGVRYTPTFFINGRRYDGPWDESSFSDALLGSFGHRVRTAALRFASWAPSAGLLLLLASFAAVLLTNSEWGPAFERFWLTEAGLSFGDNAFRMPLIDWIDDALLTLFFLVVGLEIKREFTVGHLANRRSAALPIAAAIGGMVVPALAYRLLITDGSWSLGWGVPMATDTAFAIALLALLGSRVPIELRIFLTAAAIVDDIGAILVVALFYSGTLDFTALGAALAVVGVLAWLNNAGVYRLTPYLLIGVVLWAFVHTGGLHATLAGVVLAALIPTRQPPDYHTLMVQADTILAAEAQRGGEQYRRGPSEPALQAIDEIHDRLESPADRMLRSFGPRSSYLVLPVFAFANAGVEIDTAALEGRGALMLAIATGLALGKPLGFVGAAWLAVKSGLAAKSHAYGWQQLLGAGALAGIGFTMSLFIARQAFPLHADFAAAKIAVFAASTLSALIGLVLIWRAAEMPAK